MNWTKAGFLALLIVVASTCLTAGRRDLFVGDETKYGEIVREMRATGSVFVPVLNGEPYSHKPPIHFWIVYALSSIFGPRSTWPFVLPSILSMIALFFVCRSLGRRLFDASAADCGAFILCCSYLVWGTAQTARMDVLFVALLSLAMLFLWEAFTDAPSKIIAAGLVVGVASLVKGPMAQVLTILMFVVWSIMERRRPRGTDAVGLVAAVGVPLLWLIPATLQRGESYLEELLVKQSMGRAIHAWVHKEPVWFYLGRYPASFFPWFATLPFVIAFVWRHRDDPNRRARMFSLAWILVVFGAFSALSSKLDIYMLPAIPAAALLLGSYVMQFPAGQSRGAIQASRAVMILLIVAGAGAAIAAPMILRSPDGTLFSLPILRGVSLLIAAAGLAALAWSWRRGSLESAIAALGFAALVPLLVLAVFLIPPVNRIGSTSTLIESLSRQESDGRRIALYQCPFLWSRTLPASYDDVHYIGRNGLMEWAGPPPTAIATRANRAAEVGMLLSRYRKVDSVRMIGKDFDVYRLR